MTSMYESGLIQMNTHMVVTSGARVLIVAGIIVAALFIFLAVLSGTSERRSWRYVAAFMLIAVLGAGMAIVGANQPRQKVIMACASGPVSLDQVAAIYDIKEVDGKMLKLIER